MKKFDFRFEALYEYRRRLEEITLHELVSALKRLEEEDARLGVLKELYMGAADGLDKAKPEADAGTLRLHGDYIEGLRRHIEEQDAAICAFRAEFEAKEAELLGRSAERQTLGKAREKEARAHAQTAGRAEQKELDEISAAIFRKKG
ncbi:MAG: flagellar export protein FliJ [Deltaproteobacteria bacterium]|nr:flagellar export protein FliJ [Deltaproteobacteria bacterium]